jgi:hypothetical protein
VVEINPDETPLTHNVTYALPGPAGQVLPKLLKQVKPDIFIQASPTLRHLCTTASYKPSFMQYVYENLTLPYTSYTSSQSGSLNSLCQITPFVIMSSMP